MISRLFSLGKWLFVTVVALIILTVLAVSVLMYSSFGLNVVIWGAEKIDPRLSISSAQGRLGETFSLHGVAYQNPDLNVDLQLKEVSLSLDVSRLFQPAVSLNTLSVTGMKLKLQSSPGTADDAAPTQKSSGTIYSPLPIEVKHAQLNDIHLTMDDTHVGWKQLATGVTWRGSKLTLLPTLWQGIIATLPASESQAAKGASTSSPANGTPKPFHFSGLALPDIVIPLTVNVPQFTAKDIRVVQGKQIQKIGALELSTQAKQSKVSITKLSVDTPQMKVSLNGDAQLSGSYPLSLAAQGEYLAPPLQGQSMKMTAKGSLADLSLALIAKGKLTTELNANASLTKDNLPFSIDAQNTSGRWPLEQPAQYQADIKNISVQGSLEHYTFTMNGEVQGSDMADLRSEMNGEGSLTGVNLQQFALYALDGKMAGQVSASWSKGIDVDASVHLDNFRPQAVVKNAPGVLNGEASASAKVDSGNHWKVDVSKLDINGRIKNYPLIVKGMLTANSTEKGMGVEVRTPNLVVTHGPNHIILDGELADKWDLNARIKIADLSKSLAQSSGNLAGNIHLTGDQETPHADIRLNGNHVQWQDLFVAKKLELRGDVSSFTHPDANLDLTLKNGSLQQQRFNSIALTVKGGIEQHDLSLALVSPELNGDVVVNGQLNKDFTLWKGTLTKVVLEHQQQVLKLQQPVPVEADIAAQKVLIEPHCWGIDDASLCLTREASVAADNIQADIALKSLSLAMLTKWLPNNEMTAEGMVNGTASLVWQKGTDAILDNTINVSKGLVKVKGEQGVTIGWENASLNSELKDGKLASRLQVNLTDNGQIAVNAEIPDVKTEHKAISGNLALKQINLDFLQPLLGEYSKAGALINSNIALSGELLHPQANGNLTVSDIHAAGDLFPIEVKHGELLVSLQGYQATMKALVNTPDGDLNVEGDADWANLSQWAVNSHVFAEGLKVSMPPMVSMKVVPDIKLAMTPDNANVSGTVKLPWGRIKVEELPESAIEVSSDQVIVDQHWEPVEKKSLPFKLATNVEVDIGDDFKLEAFGLKGYLDGILKISQKENSPFVVGDVSITDGTYRSFGQDLVIQQGKVMMNGSVNKPYVSIQAIRNPDNIEDDVTAGIKVTGPADNPSVTVFSDPSMAQANALSYLLRGKDLDADSSGDNSMTTMLIGLSLAQSGHIVGELGQAIGVQDLKLDTSGSGDETQVNISGYVLPDLQVKYGVGIFNSVGEFTLRYRLVRNLYVEAVSGLTSAVELLYQFEFD